MKFTNYWVWIPRYEYKILSGEGTSTTGNSYGIYDLSGGAWERVATYITNGSSFLSYGSSFVAKIDVEIDGYKKRSTKYVTVYPYNSSNDDYTTNYNTYKQANYGYGDAVLEISTSGSDNTSWFNNYSCFPKLNGPFFVRGGGYNNASGAGIFCFDGTFGGEDIYSSFRPVLEF